MLKRVRIEVEGEESAAATEMALTKYEQVLQVLECDRFHVGGSTESVYSWQSEKPVSVIQTEQPVWAPWRSDERLFADEQLGREVTDEVIEYDAALPGYKGRRIVKFTRLDSRSCQCDSDVEGCSDCPS